jgi:hypothetical protein
MRAKQRDRLSVLDQTEDAHLLNHVPTPCDLTTRLIYGSGLRLMGCVRLRV